MPRPSPLELDDLPPQKTYAEARGLIRLLIAAGFIAVVVGLTACAYGALSQPTIEGDTIRRALWIIGGTGAVISGFLAIALAQVVDAVVDTARNTAEAAALLRQRR